MSTTTICLALFWGAISGLLAIHALANILAISFCLHGLLMTRWKRLVNKAAPGILRYTINLNLLLRVSLYALLFGGLLHYGDSFIYREFRFQPIDTAGILYFATATCTAASRLNAMRKRSMVIWRMSHHFDYAERRQRTQLLKS